MRQNHSPTDQLEPIGAPPSLAAVIAARHPSIRSSLVNLLAHDDAFTPVMVAADLVAAVRLLRSSSPDVVLVDRAVLGAAGMGRVPMLLAAAPEAVGLVVGMGNHPGYETAARAAGAAGYLRLDHAPDQLAAAVRAACSAHHG